MRPQRRKMYFLPLRYERLFNRPTKSSSILRKPGDLACNDRDYRICHINLSCFYQFEFSLWIKENKTNQVQHFDGSNHRQLTCHING